MPLRLGPAGVPLSCKGRTIVEGMDDITVLGLDAMEIQTVRTVQPKHFDQYWQAGNVWQLIYICQWLVLPNHKHNLILLKVEHHCL